VNYADRAREDHHLLVWDGRALAEPVEITGHPELRLNLRSSMPDIAVFAYLEAIDPEGHVRYITEGELRLRYRDHGAASPTYTAGDDRPIESGELAEARIRMLPTSVVVPVGWRLRLALAGFDSDTFERVPAAGAPKIEVVCGGATPSELVLPIGLGDGAEDPAAGDGA